ncbi:formyl transferase [Nitratireductor sp. StC3]|uniref:formyl transferase n=1 Tax=Nitratireductor sp. StC3 TaxID=2126741 RepID=UPI000D0D35F2|nr:formyl transferase [Nitratireductor sp. StC3]PSM19006.1 formyl transferase [Nitratireductor sp. StC3]
MPEGSDPTSPDDHARSGVCVVTAGGPYPWIIVNALARRFGAIDVIEEEGEPQLAFLRRRARMTGWISLAGQFGTMVLIRLGKRLSARRIAGIVAAAKLEPEPASEQRIIKVESVNSDAFVREIDRLEPRVVLLAGCRIVRPWVLARLSCPVLNYHAGITPAYRGMNGGYWALAEGDRENFGATVHLVDAGVDTGMIVRQVRGSPEPGDTIMTYAHRLAALSREMCADAVADALAGRLAPRAPEGPSRQWYHPTIWSYLWTGLTRGVW